MSEEKFGRQEMSGLTRIWKDKDMTKQTKRRLVNTLVFVGTMHGCESWTVNKRERKKIDSFMNLDFGD